MVGRDDDVAVLDRAFALSAEGAPRFVIVRGEAGIGKSRLVRETTDTAADGGSIVLLGECLDIGAAGLPYLPIAVALRGLTRRLDPERLEQVVGPGRRDLAAIVPELGADVAADGEAPAGGGGLPSGLGQARLFERVLGLLRSLSGIAPVILVVEDVHWIDRATRDLLTFLSRNVTDERLAIVLTCREHDLPRGHPILAWLAEIARAPSTVVVRLGRLDRPSVERQLRVLSGSTPEPGIADRVWRRSQGNPLFVEELAAADAEGGDQPASLVEILLARVGRLDADDPLGRRRRGGGGSPGRRTPPRRGPRGPRRRGRGRPPGGAGRAASWSSSPPTAGRASATSSSARASRASSCPGPAAGSTIGSPGAWRANPSSPTRARPARPPSSPTTTPQAGLSAEAYVCSIDAATAAEAVHAYADAHRHLERALELEAHAGDGGDVAGQASLRRRAADDADLGGDVARSLELMREALALVDPAADPVIAGLIHSRIGYLQWAIGDSTTALDAHREAVRLVPAEPPTTERAKVLASLGGALMGAGLWAESRALCEAAIACAVAAGAGSDESRARNMLGSDLVALGEIDAGIAELREACRIARTTGPADVLILGHYNLALNLLTADRLDEALVEAEQGREAARTAGPRAAVRPGPRRADRRRAVAPRARPAGPRGRSRGPRARPRGGGDRLPVDHDRPARGAPWRRRGGDEADRARWTWTRWTPTWRRYAAAVGAGDVRLGRPLHRCDRGRRGAGSGASRAWTTSCGARRSWPSGCGRAADLAETARVSAAPTPRRSTATRSSASGLLETLDGQADTTSAGGAGSRSPAASSPASTGLPATDAWDAAVIALRRRSRSRSSPRTHGSAPRRRRSGRTGSAPTSPAARRAPARRRRAGARPLSGGRRGARGPGPHPARGRVRQTAAAAVR